MLQLRYKSFHPVEILESRTVATSKIDGRDRGVSMTTNPIEFGHGPFMIVFEPDLLWYQQFIECQYDDPPPEYEPGEIAKRIRRVKVTEEFRDPRIYKPHFFAVEQEWWSEHPVHFELSDIERIIFMSDSPGSRIHPRISKRWWNELKLKFGQVVRMEVDSTRYPPNR